MSAPLLAHHTQQSPTWTLGSGNMRYGFPFSKELLDAPARMPTTLFVDRFRWIAPQVLCLQEVMEWHLPAICATLNLPHVFFSPMHHFIEPPSSDRNRLGVAILSAVPFQTTRQTYYAGFDDAMPRNWQFFDFGGTPMSSVYQEVTLELNGDLYTVGNTHFTWSEELSYPPQQGAALERLITAIGPGREVIWCADTNMKRGGPGWNLLQRFWTDNIPLHVRTTFDPTYSRAAQNGLEAVIDGIFSTSGYGVTGVQLHSGISDHQALSTQVQRRRP